MHLHRLPYLPLALLGSAAGAVPEYNAAVAPAPIVPAALAPAVLPGKGLAQHPFLYAGEWDYRKPDQTMFLVRDGKVVWTYSIPIKTADGTLQEWGDATLLSNGNIVFSRKTGGRHRHPRQAARLELRRPCRHRAPRRPAARAGSRAHRAQRHSRQTPDY